ncbi:hypothetical protein XENOCAPTIV_019074 [Xenoophorus captivus]|uniref:Uncharacterized protein n=1 Tax=Xenoophorus captivus TaxID=1517983 RepID=A0ABV0RB76_9TELE
MDNFAFPAYTISEKARELDFPPENAEDSCNFDNTFLNICAAASCVLLPHMRLADPASASNVAPSLLFHLGGLKTKELLLLYYVTSVQMDCLVPIFSLCWYSCRHLMTSWSASGGIGLLSSLAPTPLISPLLCLLKPLCPVSSTQKKGAGGTAFSNSYIPRAHTFSLVPKSVTADIRPTSGRAIRSYPEIAQHLWFWPLNGSV